MSEGIMEMTPLDEIVPFVGTANRRVASQTRSVKTNSCRFWSRNWPIGITERWTTTGTSPDKQFSQLELLQNMNENIRKSLTGLLLSQTINNTIAASLIGRGSSRHRHDHSLTTTAQTTSADLDRPPAA
jgi:hypothetical protein